MPVSLSSRNRTAMRLLFAPLCLVACAPEVHAVKRGVPTGDRALDRAWSQVLDDVTAWRADQGVAGVAVAVVVDGRVRYAEGFGMADDRPVGPHTVFRWASISKPFVATAVLQAHDDGLLDLDAPLSTWLTDFAVDGPLASGDPTVEEMLTHHSGIADRLIWQCDTETEWLEDTFDGDFSLPLLSPPGAFYNYSNSGFSALGAVLEQVHGRPFAELIDDEVLDPMGLRSATFVAEEAVELPSISGMSDGGATLLDLAEWDCVSSRPAAWLHADVTELGRFIEHLDTGPIAPRMSEARDTHLRADGNHRIGPGLFSIAYRDRHEAWVHDGWVTGFSSELAWLPEERLGVAVVANRGLVDVSAVRNTVLDRFLGYDPDEPRHQPPEPELRPELVGLYEQPVEIGPSWAFGELEVYEEEGTLRLRTANGLRPELVQIDGDAYAVAIGGETTSMRFLPYDDALWMVSRNFVARRLPDEADEL